jgi:acetylornithine deacetylase/succinyl-diaminopimelate desuccinylase-like protein
MVGGIGTVEQMDTAGAIEVVRKELDGSIETLEELVRIPSISIAPDRVDDVAASAEAVAEVLSATRLDNVRELTANGSHPYVVGEWMGAGDAPTVLLYAHHDVQPTGIVANWASDPFEPRREAGRLYGRGSADDKAGAVAHAAAVSAWLAAAGELPCNVRVLVEGEEEIGSPNLEAFLAAHLDELAADVLVLADAGNWKVGVPALTYSLRGLAGADVRVRAIAGPVHSGMAGGVVPDPAMALSRMLASLVDEHGGVAIAGFVDDATPLTAEERARMDALPSDGERLKSSWGFQPGVEFTGDPNASLWERIWRRPSVTITGFDSHPIEGASNQIVAGAAARISVRLVPGQDPARATELLRRHLEAAVPWGLELEFRPHPSLPAWITEPTGWAFDAALQALRGGFGTEPVLMGVGGSIPFVGPFADAFGGIPALLLGPADPTSAIHGENESLHLDDWRKLIESEVLLLNELAATRPSSMRS